ncbi:MAG: hypothetical protein ACK5KQ_00910 [Anaerorhabdus sp.]
MGRANRRDVLREEEIENEFFKLRIYNFGASVGELIYKGQSVVTSFYDKIDYVCETEPYLCAMVGPTAGRISGGKYKDQGKVVKLSLNDAPNHLHGGETGISEDYFTLRVVNDHQIECTLECSHEEDGYPSGNFKYKINYILDGEKLIIESHCEVPKRTLLNMTWHAYFNFSSMREDILDYTLKIKASKRTRTDVKGHPNAIVPIEKGDAFDFNDGPVYGDNFKKGSEEFKHTLGYDHALILDDNKIELFDPKSKIGLEIETDQEAVVVYGANWFKEDIKYQDENHGTENSCVALEVQQIPNAVNLEGCKAKFYDENNPYYQKTTYRFFKK